MFLALFRELYGWYFVEETKNIKDTADTGDEKMALLPFENQKENTICTH